MRGASPSTIPNDDAMVLFSLISTDDAWMACASFVTVITGVDA
jgi:hypothetical protein